MKLDPSLIRDVLQADPDGATPATPQQWLGFPAGSAPSIPEIQTAYQRQVQKLKQARDRFDAQQLKQAAQLLKEAALALRPGQSQPESQERARPVAQPVAKPLAQPVTSPAPGDSQPEIAIRTRGPARRKKSRSGLWGGVLVVLVLLSGGAVFWLQQTGRLDLAQVMGQAQPPGPQPVTPSLTDDDSPASDNPRRDDMSESDPEPEEDDSQDSDPDSETQPVDPPVTPPITPSVGPEISEGPDNVETSDSMELDQLASILAEWEGPRLEELALQFDRCMAAIFQRDAAAVEVHLGKMKSLDPTGSVFNLLERIHRGYIDFDRMFLERLPLIEQKGEIESGQVVVGIRSLSPNRYAFRIAGENRTFQDQDLPLGLKLAMFAAVIPEYPADDVYLHVIQCLPYLRGQPDLKESLLERLAGTRSMKEGNLFDSSVRPVLEDLVRADGSLGLWFYEREPTALSDWRTDRTSEPAAPDSASKRGHLEAYLDSVAAGSAVPELRLGVVDRCLPEGELALPIGLIREHWLWEQPNPDTSKKWFAMLKKHEQAAELAPAWLNLIEIQLADEHNVPELDDCLLDLGKQLARAYQRREARQWTQRFQSVVNRKTR